MSQIDVTKSYLPPIEEFQGYVEKIWQNGQLTNQGPLLKELEASLSEKLRVNNFHFVTNGTIALQLAIRSLDMQPGDIITTPFSYVATTSAILWEGFKPIYADIDDETLCIDPEKIEQKITSETRAILAVHVFGYPCDVKSIEKIALKHGIKVIYDGAHAFGVRNTVTDQSIFEYGDISTCSFHATKLFHTIEGGALVVGSNELSEKVELMKRFGHNGDKHIMLGINAKQSEFNAAMGLCLLNHIDEIQSSRERIYNLYKSNLSPKLLVQTADSGFTKNFAYFPIIFPSEDILKNVLAKLNKNNIYPRRYFYPSLNRLPYIDGDERCPVSEDIASRILCLPFYADLEEDPVRNICAIVNSVL